MPTTLHNKSSGLTSNWLATFCCRSSQKMAASSLMDFGKMRHLPALFLLPVSIAFNPTGSSAQFLQGTGFSWGASGIEGSCQILSGDDKQPLTFSFKTGQKYIFVSSCQKKAKYSGSVRAYEVETLSVSPGIIELVDQRGRRWSILKERPGKYSARRIKSSG